MTQDAMPKTLRQFWNHEFTSGPSAGKDYVSFQRKYQNWLVKELDGYIVTLSPNHYEFSAVIERPAAGNRPSKYVYMSIPDVRFFRRKWATNILVRTMAHSRDWTGGPNRYCDISDVRVTVDRLMEEDL